jgi:hypothetical protein
MKSTPSVRPFVLLLSCAFTLLIGIWLGARIAGRGADSVARPLRESSQAATLSRMASEPSDHSLGDHADSEELAVAAGLALDPQVEALDALLRLSQTDPLAAATQAMSASNDLERLSQLALLLSAAAPEDMADLAHLISVESNDFERGQQMGMLYYAWGRIDAPAAVAYAEAQGGRDSRMGATVALSSWASLDPASARAWVDSSENPGRYQRGLLLGWSEKQPLQALQYISNLDKNSNLMDRRTAPQIAQNLIDERGVMALDDVAALPATRSRRALLGSLADELGETDPVAAAVRLSAIEDSEVLRTAVPEVAQEWARNDPYAAVEFVSKYQENTQLYSRAMAEVVEEWAERDPYGAGTYLNEQPASPELDRAVSEYSREAARVDPEAAMSFAVSVSNEKLRQETVRRVVREWQRSSPKAYASWVEQNPEFAPASRKKD